MKILATILLGLVSTFLNSQIIEVKIEKWSKYSHPKTMTLHVAMISDSVETLYTKTGMGNYTINFDTQEIVMVGYQNEIKVSKIVKMIPTKSLVNVDAEFEGKYYNFVVSENIDGKMSLIIQNFEKEGNNSVGFYCNDAKVSIK